MPIATIERALRAKLEKDLATETKVHAVHLAIRGVLTNFVGKKLTKRFTDKVTAAVNPLFPTPPVCFYPHPGKLVLWYHPSVPYDQRWLFFIAGEPSYLHPTHSTAHPTLEGYDYENQSSGSAAETRNAERLKLLKPGNTTLALIALRIHNVRESAKQLSKSLEPFDSGLAYVAEELAKEKP